MFRPLAAAVSARGDATGGVVSFWRRLRVVAAFPTQAHPVAGLLNASSDDTYYARRMAIIESAGLIHETGVPHGRKLFGQPNRHIQKVIKPLKSSCFMIDPQIPKNPNKPNYPKSRENTNNHNNPNDPKNPNCP